MKKIFVLILAACFTCNIKTIAQSSQWSAWQQASYPYSQALSYRLKCGEFSKLTGDTEWFLEVKNNTKKEYTIDAGIFPIGNIRLKKTVHGDIKAIDQFHTSYKLPVSRSSYDLLKVVFVLYDKKTGEVVN